MTVDPAILDSLQRYDHGWSCDLPESVRFLGHTLSLRFETRDAPTKRPPPRPSPGDVELARQILAGLAEVLVVAERRFEEYDPEEYRAALDVACPQIWISRDDQEREGLDFWTLVIESEPDSEHATHIEFRGLEYQVAWGGD